MLIAAGPDFQVGFEDKLPTANVDVAREIIQILDLPIPPEVAGRGLMEARRNLPDKPSSEVRSQILEASRDFSDGRWKQIFHVSQYLTVEYMDEGNGSFTKK